MLNLLKQVLLCLNEFILFLLPFVDQFFLVLLKQCFLLVEASLCRRHCLELDPKVFDLRCTVLQGQVLAPHLLLDVRKLGLVATDLEGRLAFVCDKEIPTFD